MLTSIEILYNNEFTLVLKVRLLKLTKKIGGDFCMLSGIGTTEIVVIGLTLLVLFGGKKLPELARGMGGSIKEFRKAANEGA